MRKLLVFTAIACAASVQAQIVDTLASQELQEVIVAGVRAQKNAPFAVANIKRQNYRALQRLEENFLSSLLIRLVYSHGARMESELALLQCAFAAQAVAVLT